LYAFAAFEARGGAKRSTRHARAARRNESRIKQGKTLPVARPLIPQVTVSKTLFLNHRQTMKNKPDGTGNFY
jgi:hypothetical protein